MKTKWDLFKEKVNEMSVEEVTRKFRCEIIRKAIGIELKCSDCKFAGSLNIAGCKVDYLNSPAFELTREQRTELQYMSDCGYTSTVYSNLRGKWIVADRNGTSLELIHKYSFVTEETLLVDLLGGGENE